MEETAQAQVAQAAQAAQYEGCYDEEWFLTNGDLDDFIFYEKDEK